MKPDLSPFATGLAELLVHHAAVHPGELSRDLLCAVTWLMSRQLGRAPTREEFARVVDGYQTLRIVKGNEDG